MAPIVIAICTRDRLDGLDEVLRGIARQRLARLARQDIRVEVVDNSAAATARALVLSLSGCYPFPLGYRSEPRGGLSFARNAAIEAVLSLDASVLVFIDDDEIPMPDWLDALVPALTASEAGAVVGPVRPLFARPPSAWLPTRAYLTEARVQAGRVVDGYTGNAAIRVAAIVGSGLRFDHRLDHSGGEDTAFFSALKASGHEIAWAPGAVVYERVPPSRMRAAWLLRRWYRTGLVEARLAAFAAPGPVTTATSLGKGALRIAGGAARLGAAVLAESWRRPDRVVSSAYTLCRGIGYAAGSLGWSHRAYGLRDTSARQRAILADGRRS